MTRSSRTSRFTFLILSLVLAAIPMLFGVAAFAQSPNCPPGATGDYNLQSTACLAGLPYGKVSPVLLIATIINVIVSVIGVVAVIMVVYGGALWMTAAGNEEKITQARRLLANAVIGLAIILMAFAVSSFVLSTLKQATIAPNAPADSCAAPNYCSSSIACVNQLASYTCPNTGDVCCAP